MDVLHIFGCTQDRRHPDVVFIIPVSDQHASRLHIIGSQCILNILYRNAGNGHLLLVGYNLQHSSRYPGNIGHGHFGQLFDAAFHHILGQLAQVQELLFIGILKRSVALQGHVQVEHRNVRRTGLDGLGTVHFLGQAVHGRINLFVYFNEGQVGIHPKIKLQTDNARTVACFTLYFPESGHLQQLTAHRSHHRVLQFACRRVVTCHLYRNLRYGDIGQQRYRQGIVCHQSDDETGGKRHQYRYGTL